MGKIPRLNYPTVPKHDQIELPPIVLRHIWWLLTDEAVVNFLLFEGAQAVALVD